MRNRWIPRSSVSLFSMLGLGLVIAFPLWAQSLQSQVTDDWLSIDQAKCKLFLPGRWSVEVKPSEIGVWILASMEEGKVTLTVQSIEGKQTATPENLEKIFSKEIANGAKASILDRTSNRIRARYIASIEKELVVFEALFVREGKTSWMVYARALMDDTGKELRLDNLMKSILSSFSPAAK